MNKINGWRGYVLLAIFLMAFAIAIAISNGTPVLFRVIGATTFAVSSGIALRNAKALYDKDGDS